MSHPLIAFCALILVAWPSAAQVTHHTPYAGLESREIKALSAEEVRQLLEGEGMGLALAAELNGLPGPLHVLELADSLALTAAQRASVEAIFAEMKSATGCCGGTTRGVTARALPAAGDGAPWGQTVTYFRIASSTFSSTPSNVTRLMPSR